MWRALQRKNVYISCAFCNSQPPVARAPVTAPIYQNSAADANDTFAHSTGAIAHSPCGPDAQGRSPPPSLGAKKHINTVFFATRRAKKSK